MGFFNNLKKKLFTLDAEKKEKKPKGKSKPSNSSKAAIKEEKLEKKLAKKRQINREKSGKIDKYIAGMEKSGSSFSQKLKELRTRHNSIDEDYFEELEEILIMSDIGVSMVMDIIDEIKKDVKANNITDLNLINEIVADKMFLAYANKSNLRSELDIKDGRLNVVMLVGVNGVGKTTTIAKLVNMYKNKGKKILIAAGDTFRAGAVEQLDVWAQRLGADIVKPTQNQTDSASVVFDALKQAKEKEYDILLIDTAGRLQNKVNLMNELGKVKKIITSYIPEAPHEVILIIDATTGQNGVNQATEFKDVTNVTGIILTKMDGTSKGGIILSIKEKLDIPVKYIGLGEKLDDLQEFDLDAFIYGLTKDLMDE